MKNLFRFAMAVAVLFTASCAKEDISSSIGGGEVEVTFTANLADLGTRAIGDGTKANQVFLAIYEAGTNNALDKEIIDPTKPIDVVDKKASISVVLLKDKKYDLVFWAQNKDLDCFELNVENRYMEIDYTGAKSQVEKSDAFFLVRNNWKAGEGETTFELRRPFAQLNVGLSENEVSKVTKNGVDVEKLWSKAVVKNVANVLDLGFANPGAVRCSDNFAGEITFRSAAKPKVALEVSGVEYEYLSMNYLLVNGKQNVDVTYTFVEKDAEGTKYIRPYYNVPVQRNYRTNIVGNLLSSEYDFNVIIVPGFDGDENLDAKTQIFNVNNNEDLKDALTEKVEDHIEHIIINLEADLTYDVAAWANKAMGGEFTKDITINGIPASRAAEPYTLTFKNTDSDWNNIVTKGAKLILNDLKITNSGYNDGPWNRHDLNFACEVEMNNVVSDKALALKAGATLKNTTITEDNTSDVYAIWIQPNGQTVTIENCTINTTAATDGRGIKIDEQYVDAPKKVILNVSGTSFATEEKSAILVKSVAGAEIVWGDGNDISVVAADSVYAVWVDEASEAYYNLVEVTGALVRLEGSAAVSAQDKLLSAIKQENAVVYLEPKADGSQYLLEGKLSLGKGVKLIGAGSEPVKVFNDWGSNAFANQAHFTNTHIENINFTNNLVIDAGIANGNVTFKNCVFGGKNAHQGVHFDSGNGVVVFDNCTFVGRNMFGSSLVKVIFNNCTFLNKKSSLTGADKWTGVNMWGKYEFNNCTFDTEATCNVKCDGVVADFNNCSYVDNKDIKNVIKNGPNYNAEINFNILISNAAELFAFANEVNVNGSSFAGKTVKLANDIDLDNAAWTPVGQTGATQFQGTFDGNGKTIYNLNIDKTSETGKHYSSGLFGWLNAATVKNVTIEGATVKGNHNVGVIAGYLETSGCTIENCHVIGAAVECHHANDDACGDKCGGVVGHAGNAGVAVKDCTVADSTVKAGRDAGQVVGAALAVNVTGCSATNVEVTANGECTGANVRNEVIGRLL